MRRAAVLAWLSVASTGCSGVLGLDAPQLDPCLTGASACVDGSAPADANAPDASPASDAASDAGGDGPLVGVRCGGDPYPAVGCNGATKTCCQVIDDAGAPTYACTSSTTTCDGYAIACASNADCSGDNVCCHYNSGTKCVGSTTCPSDSLVCEPSGPTDQCPSGWKCTGDVIDDGVPAPYFLCAQ